jgi:FixJ family two-component response regulator
MKSTSSPPVVYVVDDDELVRRSLQRLFMSAGHDAFTFSSAESYLKQELPTRPACLVLDLQMPGLNGFALQDELTARGSHEGIVFISGHGDVPACARALKQGAVDFLMKPFGDDRLLASVEEALAYSERALKQTLSRQGVQELLATLTPRELEVLRGVIAGYLNKQIAADLGTTEKTVKVHRGRVMEKLEVHSVAELVRMCAVIGLEPGPTGAGREEAFSS